MEVNTTFQGVGSHGHKKGECTFYQCYGTHQGGKGDIIDAIIDRPIKFSCHIIAGKIMQHYTKGECTLNAICVVEFYLQGVKLSSCKFFMDELLQACADVQEKGGYFIFIYLLTTFIVWKWNPPHRRERVPSPTGACTTLLVVPLLVILPILTHLLLLLQLPWVEVMMKILSRNILPVSKTIY